MSNQPPDQSRITKKVTIDEEPGTNFRFGSVWLQALYRDKTISFAGFGIVQMVLHFNAVGRPCFASNQYIAGVLGISAASVANEVSKLYKQGWLLRRCRDGYRTLTINTAKSEAYHVHFKSDSGSAIPAENHFKNEHKKTVSLNTKAFKEKRSPPPASRCVGTAPNGQYSFDEQPPIPPRKTVVAEPLLPPMPCRNDIPPRCKTEPKHDDLAAALVRFAKKRTRPVSKQKRNWAEALAVMERQDGHSWAEIRAVWDWYAENYKAVVSAKPGRLPFVENAKQFRDRFDWICRVRDQDRAREPVAEETLSPDAKRVLDQLIDLDWPDGCQKTLPAAVVRSLDNLVVFVAQLERLALDRYETGVRAAVLDAIGYGGSDFLVQWFDEIRTRSRNWDRFTGDLTRYSWSSDNEFFARAARARVAAHCGDPGAYDKLLARFRQPQSLCNGFVVATDHPKQLTTNQRGDQCLGVRR